MTNLTLVSCYYRIPSKRHHDEYTTYIRNLLTNIKGNIVIYTSEDLVDYLQQFSNHKPNVKIIVKPFNSINLYNKYQHIWTNQEQKDNQKYTHRTHYCYVLWNSKLDFLKETIESNPFGSDKFMWLDLGAVRTPDIVKYLKTFPKYENASTNRVDIVMIENFSNRSQRFFQDEVHLGGLYGGGVEPLLRFHELFYRKFDEYLGNDRFIGCDQQMISSVYLENPDLFNIIKPKENNHTQAGKLIPLVRGIDIWFYLIYYYSV